LQLAIDSLGRSGGTLFVTAGVYYLPTPVIIDRSSVEIRGENMGGDLFFVADSYYNGFYNKTATVFVAVGMLLACTVPPPVLLAQYPPMWQCVWRC
jgi:hypothetical protein